MTAGKCGVAGGCEVFAAALAAPALGSVVLGAVGPESVVVVVAQVNFSITLTDVVAVGDVLAAVSVARLKLEGHAAGKAGAGHGGGGPDNAVNTAGLAGPEVVGIGCEKNQGWLVNATADGHVSLHDESARDHAKLVVVADLLEIEHLGVGAALRIVAAFVVVVGVVPAAGAVDAIDTAGFGGGKFHLPDLNAVALNTTTAGDARADRVQRKNLIGVIGVIDVMTLSFDR